MRLVLYLHGRGDRPGTPPGDLVSAEPWPFLLNAPFLSERWLGLAFRRQVDAVDDWRADATLAIGHSWGVWLLLCAGLQRLRRGDDLPFLLLLSAVLGRGAFQGLGFIAPRSRCVRQALGLEGRDSRHAFPSDRVTFVHGALDEQSPVEPVLELRERFHLVVVPGTHRLETPAARRGIARQLRRHRRR